MRRRRSRSKPFSLLGALLVELVTMVVIIAVAQPSWTRNLIEHVSSSQAAEPAAEFVSPSLSSPISAQSNFGPSAAIRPDVPARYQSTNFSAAFAPISQPQDFTQRIASAQWPAPTSVPAVESRYAPHSPIYPPAAYSPPPPAWSHSY